MVPVMPPGCHSVRKGVPLFVNNGESRVERGLAAQVDSASRSVRWLQYNLAEQIASQMKALHLRPQQVPPLST
jgi:hypothetical protein